MRDAVVQHLAEHLRIVGVDAVGDVRALGVEVVPYIADPRADLVDGGDEGHRVDLPVYGVPVVVAEDPSEVQGDVGDAVLQFGVPEQDDGGIGHPAVLDEPHLVQERRIVPGIAFLALQGMVALVVVSRQGDGIRVEVVHGGPFEYARAPIRDRTAHDPHALLVGEPEDAVPLALVSEGLEARWGAVPGGRYLEQQDPLAVDGAGMYADVGHASGRLFGDIFLEPVLALDGVQEVAVDDPAVVRHSEDHPRAFDASEVGLVGQRREIPTHLILVQGLAVLEFHDLVLVGRIQDLHEYLVDGIAHCLQNIIWVYHIICKSSEQSSGCNMSEHGSRDDCRTLRGTND